MARYIALLKFTEQGAANIKKSTTRARAFDKLAAKAGVKVEGQYWTMGRYDGVLILSAADEAKVLHMLTSLAAQRSHRNYANIYGHRVRRDWWALTTTESTGEDAVQTPAR